MDLTQQQRDLVMAVTVDRQVPLEPGHQFLFLLEADDLLTSRGLSLIDWQLNAARYLRRENDGSFLLISVGVFEADANRHKAIILASSPSQETRQELADALCQLPSVETA